MKTTSRITSIALFVAVLAGGCQKEPEANITADKTTVETGESVKFTNTTVNGESYEWDFGDGTSSSEKSPTKIFAQAGTFNVKMTSYSKNQKKTDQATISITVENINKKFLGNYSVTENCVSDECGTYSDTYSMTIEAGSSGTTVKINNFGGGFNNINGTVSGNILTIPEHIGVTAAGTTWDINSGLFTLSGNNLSITYHVDDILYAYDCGEVYVTGNASK